MTAQRGEFTLHGGKGAHDPVDLRLPRVRDDEDARKADPRRGGYTLGRLGVPCWRLDDGRLAGWQERQALQRRPVDQLQPSVLMLDEGGAALDPVSIVQVFDAVNRSHFGVVGMAAHDAVEAAAASLVRERDLETVDGFDRSLDLLLQPG